MRDRRLGARIGGAVRDPQRRIAAARNRRPSIAARSALRSVMRVSLVVMNSRSASAVAASTAGAMAAVSCVGAGAACAGVAWTGVAWTGAACAGCTGAGCMAGAAATGSGAGRAAGLVEMLGATAVVVIGPMSAIEGGGTSAASGIGTRASMFAGSPAMTGVATEARLNTKAIAVPLRIRSKRRPCMAKSLVPRQKWSSAPIAAAGESAALIHLAAENIPIR